MTCVQYTIKDAEEHNITQSDFENFLKNHFPEYKQHGVIKFLHYSISRSYDIIENNLGLGKINLLFKQNETLAAIISRDAEKLLDKLISKNNFHWTPKVEQFKHQFDLL